MAAKLTIITFNLRSFDVGLIKFPVKEQAGACSYRPIGDSRPWLIQIRNASDSLGISFSDQKSLFSLAKIHHGRQFPSEFLKCEVKVVFLFVFLQKVA